MPYTNEQKAKAIARELGYRRRVYNRRVDEGQMSAKKMEYEIDIFEAILADYMRKADEEKLL